MLCNEVTDPYGIVCRIIPFGWSPIPSLGIPLSHPLERRCKSGVSWSPRLTDWLLQRARQEGVRNLHLDHKGPPRKTFQHLRHRRLSTLKMTTRRTVKTTILQLVSVHMHRWQPITAYSTLHGSSTMRQENINRHLPNVLLVATGMEQTHQGTHHDHHVMRLDHHRLPTPFE